jgi:Zn-dependent protease with chaperone function
MSRFLILLIFGIWLYAPENDGAIAGGGAGLVLLLGGYALLTILMWLLSRRVSRTPYGDLQRKLARFNRARTLSTSLVAIWFAVGIFGLGWKATVSRWLDVTPLGRLDIYTPGLVIGSLPAILALMGLIWAQFPADQALREQNILVQLNEDLPFCAPPSFWTYFQAKFRLQILFTAAPVIVLLFLHDLLSITLLPLLGRIDLVRDHPGIVDACIAAMSTGVILLFAPEILRHVLQTEPMPDSPLRRKLEEICRQNGIRYRQVLLWRTSYQMSNAAVMGFVPRTRYILLSDLLVETMSDEQIEAVFAHELGHVIHWHLFWLAATLTALIMLVSGPGQVLADGLASLRHPLPDWVQWTLLGGAGLGAFALVYGFVSRKFERQADVFAARTVQGFVDPPLGPPVYVGRHGADVFCSALRRIAAVNNIPEATPSWSHGSILRRMRFLADLGEDPSRTAAFDRFMFWMYIILGSFLCLSGFWTFAVLRQS